ncbi:LADA_0F09472g1_1 [Lachancea dasiensis]|uniref:LADA_0F09472g1_1 n=1 Tax=Lachancea dasiensis TaxID=1072105 RepID=A0A1G4JL60_9SACH|nr:LADA_0F09472g1_1 [Lachancea dasiensis]
MGHLQSNPSLPITSDLYQNPASSALGSSATQANLSSISTGASNPSLIPAITPYDASKFSQLFDRSTNGAPVLAGDKAKDIFLKAKLPMPTLGSIWNLCDRNNSGTLSKQEFIMAMHLIQLAMANNPALASLPEALPDYVWDSVNVSAPPGPILSANSTGLSQNSNQPSSTRISSNTFSNAAPDWTLSYEKKQQFDAIFDSLDKNKAGSLSSDVLVPFFLSSRLSQEILATVWDLADIHNNAEFSKLEFAIAMFLLQKKKSGVELPDVVPNQILQSPALGLYSTDNSQHSHHPVGEMPSIPSRDTKPMFANAQATEQRTPSALGDLLALNDSFSSPKPEPSRLASTTTMSSGQSVQSPKFSGVGIKKFQPSSTFGQNIIQEESASSSEAFNTRQPANNFTPPSGYQQPQQSIQQPSPAFEPHVSSVPAPGGHNTLGENVGPINRNASQGGASSVPREAFPLPEQPSQASSLPSVPNFLSPVTPQSSRYAGTSADGDASLQLSQATTELANLSNQVGSLTNQATLVSERKAKAQQELKRMNDLKASIEARMTTLRSSYERELAETEQIQSQLEPSRLESEELKKQLAVAEANFHAAQGSLSSLQHQLQESQQQNSKLKESIGNLNSLATSLQTDLNEKQLQVKQERSMVDVNNKQLEVSEMTVANLKNEMEGLDHHLGLFMQKHKELSDYRSTLETQHGELQSKHQLLEAQHNDLSKRERELDSRNREIQTQEQVYHQEIAKLQDMFRDLNLQRENFAKADEELQNQQLQYAQKVQELSERQMKLAMGELPENTNDIVKRQHEFSSNDDHIAKFVEESVTNSRLGGQDDDDNKQESDVFDKDLPTVGSQTEIDDDDGNAHDDLTAAHALADRFDGDLNEYGIPRTESVTSSVLNNPPQSVYDYPAGDVQTAIPVVGNGHKSSLDEQLAKGNVENTIPGGWSDAQSNKVDEENKASVTDQGFSSDQRAEVETLKKRADEAPLPNSPTTTDHKREEEFPPLEELEIEESDSSEEDDDSFEDSKDVLRSEPPQSGGILSAPAPAPEPVAAPVTITESPRATAETLLNNSEEASVNKKDAEFDDEFAGLEQAAPEEEYVDESNGNDFQEDFEQIEHKDLDDELNQGGFTGAIAPQASDVDTDPAAVGADEWDEIFAGFGNSQQGSVPVTHPEPMPIKEPVPTRATAELSQAPVRRGIATTPKSLAVEELGSMGFSVEEATKALEACNWDLGAATNYLLDSS